MQLNRASASQKIPKRSSGTRVVRAVLSEGREANPDQGSTEQFDGARREPSGRASREGSVISVKNESDVAIDQNQSAIDKNQTDSAMSIMNPEEKARGKLQQQQKIPIRHRRHRHRNRMSEKSCDLYEEDYDEDDVEEKFEIILK